MRIVSFIEDREVIQAILKHLRLWLVKPRPAPKAHAPAGTARDMKIHFYFKTFPVIPAQAGIQSF